MTVASARLPGLAFISSDSFIAPEAEAPPALTRSAASVRSPFVSLYEAEGGVADLEPRREAFANLVEELHDDEFEAAMAAVHSHGRAFHDAQLTNGVPRPQADRLLVQHFEPLLRETAALVDTLAQRYVPHESAGIVEQEFEAFVDGYTPSQPLAPEFEHFFGKLVRKVGKVAKAAVGRAWQGIKTLALAPLLKALKSQVMGFLRGAVERVIGRLPAPLQPAAQTLARKLGFPAKAADAPAPAGPPTLDPASTTAAPAEEAVATQQELDEQLAGALLARDEASLELELADGAMTAPAVPVYAELDDARERFINELQALRDGESAEPAMQHFLPALMPVLSMASKAIGHNRLAGIIARLLAPLVARLIGPQQAPQLAQALASAGLKLLNMEAAAEVDAAQLAAPAVAATVE